ncbi:MAG: hypothetical protein QUV05_00070 [Phycisphaerae bacterium]|jgi:hypothetical protein|nr:hypothetical protein [Phycisphaerae bacterium]
MRWIIWIPGRAAGFAGEEFRGVLIVPPGYEPEYRVLGQRLSRGIPLFMEPPRPPQDVLLSFRRAQDPVAVLESMREVLVDGGEVQIGEESSPIRGDGAATFRVRLDWFEQRQLRAWFDEQIAACHRDRDNPESTLGSSKGTSLISACSGDGRIP